jgi:hypothetical protein
LFVSFVMFYLIASSATAAFLGVARDLRGASILATVTMGRGTSDRDGPLL